MGQGTETTLQGDGGIDHVHHRERKRPDVGSRFDAPGKRQVGGDHYIGYTIQPAEYCFANRIPFIEGSVIKYVTRWRDKGGIKDLEKAKHFLEMLIEFEKEQTLD